MEFHVEQAVLLKCLSHMHTVVERRNTLPILSNILLEAQDNMVAITATDLDIEVREVITADIAQPGKITAPAHMLYDIVRKFPRDARMGLCLNNEQGRIILRTNDSEFALPCLSAEDFPLTQSQPMEASFPLPVSALSDAIDRTKFAVAVEETRYYLNGIYLHSLPEGDLVAVSTDGHRLAKCQITTGETNTQPQINNVIIPRKTVLELRKLLEDTKQTQIQISLSEVRACFDFNGVRLTSKLIDGKFPNYERVIPKDNTRRFKVSTKALLQSVDRVATVSMDKIPIVRLAFQEDMLSLTVNNHDGCGQAIERLKLMESYDVDGFRIGFNVRYLLEIIQQVKTDNVIFQMQDGTTPVMVCEDREEQLALYVLMPVRI